MLRGRQGRMLVVAVLFAGLMALLLGRAVDLAVLRGPDFARRAAEQQTTRVALVPQRGPIVDRNGEQLALSVNVPSIYARPRQLAGQEARIEQLAAALDMPVRAVRAKLQSRQPFIWLKRQASPREAQAVETLALPGVGSVSEGRRFYPHGALAAHVLGFVGVDSHGLEGLEARLDKVIRGEARVLAVERDARGREILRGGPTEPDEGSRVELTLDAHIQAITERELAVGVAASHAVAGAAIVLDPRTGEVLALANVPTFNPNDAGEGHDKRWRDRLRNRTITDPYEPGSTFKAILAAAALEEHIVKPTEMFNCEMGRFQVGTWTIHDSHPHGLLSFAQVIQYSSNIGAAKVGERLGKDRYFKYLRNFGFGSRTEIELPGETAGILRNASTWARIDLVTHSFGQGISVTPVQMAAAFGAIANGGTLMRPFVVRRITGPHGEKLANNQPTAVRHVISPETARTTTDLLRRVVEEEGGTGSKARLDDYSVAGKTGTAQKVDPRTGAYSSKMIGSFVGFVPADRPRLVILVLIDEPGGPVRYGGVVAAPVFKGIASAVLKDLGVEPETPTVPEALPVRMPEPAVESQQPVLELASASTMTPSFLGLSMREALTRAQRSGWDVRINGTGYVTGQQPVPGSPLATDRRLALELRPDRASARP